jgi:hypothetical protein
MADFEESRFPNCVSAYQLKKNRYWASVTLSAGSTHSRCVTWDSFNNAWGIYKGHNANCFVVFTTGGDERIYFGDYSGYVYRADTGTNDTPAGVSTAIDAYYYTKWFDYDDVVVVIFVGLCEFDGFCCVEVVCEWFVFDWFDFECFVGE